MRAAAALAVLMTVAVPAAASAAPITCQSGRTVFTRPEIRFFAVFTGERRPLVSLHVCTRRSSRPLLLERGTRGRIDFKKFRVVAGGRAGRYVGWQTLRADDPGDADPYGHYRTGWVRTRDGLVRSFRDLAPLDDVVVYDWDFKTGSIATLAGTPGNSQFVKWAAYVAATRQFRGPRLVHRDVAGRIVPSSLEAVDGRIRYRTKAGAAIIADPAEPPTGLT